MAQREKTWAEIVAEQQARLSPPVAQPPAQAPQQPPGPIVPPVAMPYYSLKGLVLKPGDPIAAMSQNELSSLNAADSGLEFQRSGDTGFTFSNPSTGEYGGFDANEATNRLAKDRRAITEGTQKMLLPVGTVQNKVTKEQFKAGTRPSSAQEFFAVPQGDAPPNYWKYNPDYLKEIENDPTVVSNARTLHKLDNDESDFEQNRDYYIKKAVSGMRRQILEAHYGKGNIAQVFHENEQEKAAPKVLPNALPVGIQGTRFQFNMPFLPTLYGAWNAAQGSALDAAAGDRMWGGGQALLDLTDVEKRTSLAEASQRVNPRRTTQKSTQAPDLGDGSEVSGFVNNLITSKYSADQLAGMTHEEKKKIAFEATGEFFQNKAKESLAQAFAITKEKREGSSGFQTEEAHSPDFSISKLTQQAASSAVPTAAPMLVSMLGSLATGGPWGGKAASAATTYKLSADSEFMGKLFEWAANNGIDVNNDPEFVMQQLVDMAAKDPKGFSGKLREMVHSARVAGGLEAGVAFTLNEGLEKINIPWAKEGSVWEAMRKLGNKDISKVLAPRVANMLQETGKEALEEYLTEVFVGLGKGIDQQVQKGDEYWEATKKQVRELIESYKGDEPNADSEQRNTAAQIGAYMSLLMKTFTGKGNPDTALIRQARTKAAKALAEKYRGQPMGTAEKIELALANMENAAASARLEKANEIMILEGHGSLWNRTGQPDLPALELPDNVQPPPAARSSEDEMKALQKEAEEARARVEQDAKQRAAKEAEEQARRDSLNEETAAYQRAADLENESLTAYWELKETGKAYQNVLQEYQNNMDHPEVKAALDAFNTAFAKYKEIERRRGK
jgi:hypothetical protein